MARKEDLRKQRKGTIINETSKRQEALLPKALSIIVSKLMKKFPSIELHHEKSWPLPNIINKLKSTFPDVVFFCYHKTSSMRPDGGILSIITKNGATYPILIIEKKNQGTNDLRALEGMTKQAKGNAIERLGKNVIGFRTALLGESIFPFVCFGDGCDFASDSSILDRVVTIAMFGELNKECVHNIGSNGVFNRGTFYFRPAEWTIEEIVEKSYSIAEKSVYYYYSKYGESEFKKKR